MDIGRVFFDFMVLAGLIVLSGAQRDPVRYFSQNKCFCSESSLFCCLLINNDGNPDFATFLYGNASDSDTSEYYSLPGVDVESSQDAVEVQPVRNRVEFIDLPDSVELVNLTEVTYESGGRGTTEKSSVSAESVPQSTGTEDDTRQEETNESGSVANNGDFGGSPPVHLGFVGCGQDVCLPKNGLQESEKGCGYYLNCWNYCGWTQKCPDFLVLNMEKQWCDWPWRLPSNHACYATWTVRTSKRPRSPVTTERPYEEMDLPNHLLTDETGF